MLSQGPKVPGPPGPSSLHWKLSGSGLPSPKFAVVLVVRDPFAGPESIDAVGPTVSTVHVRDTVAPMFPTPSTARAENV